MNVQRPRKCFRPSDSGAASKICATILPRTSAPLPQPFRSAGAYRAIDKHGVPVDFLLTAKRDLEAAKRFFRKMLKDQPLLAPDRIGTDGAGPYPPAITAARKDRILPQEPLHYVSKHLQQGIEGDHFRVKRPMPRIGGFQSFRTALRTIRGFEAMLWLRKGFDFAGAWTVCEQNRLLSVCFGFPPANRA
jgi:transposase, IS6 family